MPIITQDPNKPNINTVKFSEEELKQIPRLADPTVKIIRYMSIPKFLHLLYTQSIWFSRPDHFSDEYEGFSVINIDNDGQKESANYFRKLSYVNCWNWFRRESFHLWHIYGGIEKYGIAITSTVSKFKESIIDSNIRSTTDAFAIEYVEPNETYEGINGIICATRKKNWYDYEEEVRFVNYQGVELENTGELVQMDINNLITEILISPFIPEWFVLTIIDIIIKYGLNPKLLRRSEIKDSMLK